MRLAERFSHVPFLTVVSVVRTTAEQWSADRPPTPETLAELAAIRLARVRSARSENR